MSSIETDDSPNITAFRETPLAAAAVEVMVALFVAVESAGGCFDVLVREAIERGERVP